MSLVEDGLPEITCWQDDSEATPPVSTAADRALAAVAEIAATVPTILPPSSQVSGAAMIQVHFDQSALKLATAIKNLADGMHNIERRQDEADSLLVTLKEHVKSLEETSLTLKSQQMTILTTAKRALGTTKQQSDVLEFERCIEPRVRVGSAPAAAFMEKCEGRLREVERQVAALMQWQEEEGAKRIDQIVDRSANQDWPKIIQTNCALLKALQESVSRMEQSAATRVRGDVANEVNQLWQYIQDNYYSRRQLDAALNEIEAKVNLRFSADASSKAATLLPGGDSLTSIATYGQGSRLEGVEARIERNEARLDKSIVDISDRLDPLQDFVENQRLSAWQTTRQLPEVGQKLDQLWAQCQYYFSKVKEHDIQFSFFRASFESHKQNCLDLSDSFERPSRTRPSDNSIFPSTWSTQREQGHGTHAEVPKSVVTR
jgi:hypothetical protein